MCSCIFKCSICGDSAYPASAGLTGEPLCGEHLVREGTAACGASPPSSGRLPRPAPLPFLHPSSVLPLLFTRPTSARAS